MLSMSRTTPSPEIHEVSLMLQLAASHRLKAWVCDFAGAFNQGDTHVRSEPLYVRLPASGIPGLPPKTTIVELQREVYGLCSGPSSWRQSLLRFLKDENMHMHPMAPCLLMKKEIMGKDACGRFVPASSASAVSVGMGIGGWALLQTDDLLVAGAGPEFTRIISEVRSKYKLGKYEALSVSRSFNGRAIQQLESFEFLTSMEKYIKQ
eukprot:2738953-Amphidinium_carterae.1